MTKIAILGTGRMGTAFAKRLIDVGHSVTIWNRTVKNMDAAIAVGATAAHSIQETTAADIILISLSNAEAVGDVSDKLIAAGILGKLVIDLSTLLPQETKDIGARVTAAGADFIDCPVGGTVAPALKGALLGMAGGTELAFERAKPVLEQLCKRIELLGPIGTGAHGNEVADAQRTKRQEPGDSVCPGDWLGDYRDPHWRPDRCALAWLFRFFCRRDLPRCRLHAG